MTVGAAVLLCLAACTGKNNHKSVATAATASRAQATSASGPAAAPQPSSSPSTTSSPNSGSSSGSNAATGSASTASLTTAIRQVVQEVKPAVVQITNEQAAPDQFGGVAVPAGVGSGVIYDTQGHILTNDHVVAGAQQLQVSLPDGRSFPAKLIGGDAQTDIAVVQISGSNLPTAKLGDSTALQAGDWVVAIGNALALPGGPTVTQGVVSAVGRTVQEPPSSQGPGGAAGPFLFDLIQTDAPINPGNSGGPLVDLNGQVVGINTLAAGEAEPGVQAQGIGFSIAINTAKTIADQLVNTGKVVHPSLGIGYVPLNPAIAVQLGVNAKQGAVVLRVEPGGPAANAGLQRGDVITEVDGKALQGDSGLAEAISPHKPGDTVTLTVLRGSQSMQVKVTLGQMQSSQAQGAPHPASLHGAG
jgi:S1-C subfamily serine protease